MSPPIPTLRTMTLTPLARLTGRLLPLLALAALIPLGRPSAAAQNYQFSTLAGLAGNSGSTDGTGTAARFYRPAGIAIDSAGNVYLADTNSTIRKVSPAGVVTTLAGTAGLTGSTDGTGSAASFNSPAGVPGHAGTRGEFQIPPDKALA